MKRTFAILFSVILCMTLFLTGCTRKASVSDYEAPVFTNHKPGSINYDSAVGDGAPSQETSMPQDAGNALEGRKVIRDASLTIQTLDFDDFMRNMLERVNSLGGYVEKNSVDGNSYGSKRLRSASSVARTPSGKLDSFLNDADSLGNVTNREEFTSDVTESYVDMEARLTSLRTEYDALLELLAKSESLEDIFRVQERLSEVRYQMESYEARLRSYDSKIEFSTVSLSIYEVERETPVEAETFGQEVSRRFHESLEDVGNGFKSFAKWFIGNLPHIVVTLFFLLLPLAIVFICINAGRKRRAKRLRKQAENAAKPAPAADNTKE